MGAGCGPSGLRAFFLAQCAGKGDEDACNIVFREFVQLLVDGRAPSHLRQWFGGGSLVGVGKDDKPLDVDARPIVSGEDWRKITFKCTVQADKNRIMERLKPNQVAVGVKAGYDAMVHASRKWIDDHVRDTKAVFFARDKKKLSIQRIRMNSLLIAQNTCPLPLALQNIATDRQSTWYIVVISLSRIEDNRDARQWARCFASCKKDSPKKRAH